MSDWFEIDRMSGDGIYPTSVRYYDIMSVDKLSDGSCKIYFDDEHHYSYTVAETYEDMMARLKEYESPLQLVGPFTIKHYQTLRKILKGEPVEEMDKADLLDVVASVLGGDK